MRSTSCVYHGRTRDLLVFAGASASVADFRSVLRSRLLSSRRFHTLALSTAFMSSALPGGSAPSALAASLPARRRAAAFFRRHHFVILHANARFADVRRRHRCAAGRAVPDRGHAVREPPRQDRAPGASCAAPSMAPRSTSSCASSSSTARFVGWLEDPTGAKRLKFTFPAEVGKVSAITIGVFDATANGAAGKASVSRPPAARAARRSAARRSQARASRWASRSPPRCCGCGRGAVRNFGTLALRLRTHAPA